MESVRRMRREKGLSQQELADLAGVGQDSISAIETGKHEPHPRTLRKLAEALDVEVADFFREPAVPLAEAPREAGPTDSPEEPGLAFDVAYEMTSAEDNRLFQTFRRGKESGRAQSLREVDWQGRIEEKYAEQWPDPEYRYSRVVYGLRHASRRVRQLEGHVEQLERERNQLKEELAALKEREQAHS